MYMTGNLSVLKDQIGLTGVSVVLNVQIRTFLLGTQFSEKNINLVKRPLALKKIINLIYGVKTIYIPTLIV